MINGNVLEELEILYSNLEDIDYVLVGGLASIIHGVGRTTQDSDIVVALEDIDDFLVVLEYLGYTDVFVLDYPGTLRFSSKTKLLWIDLMVPETNFFFNMLFTYALEIPIGTTFIRIADIDDLIRLKRKSDRPRDIDDVRELEKIKGDGK